MRVLLYLIVGVIVLTLLRSVLDAVGKAFAGGSATPTPTEPRGQASQSVKSQSLKKDPVCGTFVSPATALQKTKGGETHYFCSAECRDKF